MDLSEYLSKNNLSIMEFSKLSNIRPLTIRNALKGYEIALSSAIKIEEITHGRVKCTDLKPKTKRIKKQT